MKSIYFCNGNSTGYVCPFVDCPVCQPPCQHKKITKYKTGVYEGCVENETCSGVLFTLEMTVCGFTCMNAKTADNQKPTGLQRM